MSARVPTRDVAPPRTTVARGLAVATMIASLAGGCGDNDTAVTITMRVGDVAPRYGDAPFPTDAVKVDGRLGAIEGLDAIVGRNLELVTAHVGALDGFGKRPLIELFVDGELDPSSVPARTTTIDAAAVVVNVDPASPARGQVIPFDWRYDPDRHVIMGSPVRGVVLPDGTRHAAFVTTALSDSIGRPIVPSPALARIDAAPDRWRSTAAAYGELGAQLATGGGPTIAGLAVFTTLRATAPLVAARAVLAAAAAPQLRFEDPAIVFAGTTALGRILGTSTRETVGPRAGLERWGNDNPTGIAHDHVGVVATGSFDIVRFRGDDTGTDGPDDEVFQLDPMGTPRVIARDRIPITWIVPAAAPPVDGYPVVIYGHGLGASRDQLLSFAEPLTSQGYVVVGIDMFGHGSRFDPSDQITNLSQQLQGFTGDPTLRDGFGDRTGAVTQLDFFETFRNVSAVRDGIRQSALDLSRVVQVVRTPNLDLSALAGPGGVPRLDTRRLSYLGESFGTVVGTLFASIEPDVELFVLDVPGGGILDILMPESPEIGGIALPLIEAIYGPRAQLDRWSPVLGLMQAVIDGADPLSFAPHVLRDRFVIGGRAVGPRSVIAIEVVGDQAMSNTGTHALATALGLDVLVPNLIVPPGLTPIDAPAAGNREGRTAVLTQYAPAVHGANWSAEHASVRYHPDFPSDGDVRFPLLPAPITIPQPIYETFEQVFEILRSHNAGEPPRVIVTKPPIADFDADGVPDDQDPAPYDPAR